MSKKTFEKLYYEAHRPSAYAGADKLLQATRSKYSRQSAIEWLESQDACNLNRPVDIAFRDVIIMYAILTIYGKLI